VTSRVDVGEKVSAKDISVSYWHKLNEHTQFGVRSVVARDATTVESVLSNKVGLNVEALGRTWDLSHTLKTHLNNTGVLRVLVQRNLNDRLRLNLSGHLDLHHVHNVNPKNFGIGLVYE